jgi:GT2 family glycosyltransferase
MIISVLLPTYRRPAHLAGCLDALAAQVRRPDEVLVVLRPEDDGSHAALAAWQQARRPAPFAVQAVAVTRPGFGCARNAGRRRATGDVVACIDDDARAPPDWLARLERWLADPAVGAVGGRDRVHAHGRVVPAGPPGTIVGRVGWYGRLWGNHHRGSGRPRPVHFLKGCNMAFRRAGLPESDERLAGEQYLDEIDVCLGVGARGARVIYDPVVRVDHYPAPVWTGGGRGALSPPRIYALNCNYVYIMLKHLPRPRALAALAFTCCCARATYWGIAGFGWAWLATTVPRPPPPAPPPGRGDAETRRRGEGSPASPRHPVSTSGWGGVGGRGELGSGPALGLRTVLLPALAGKLAGVRLYLATKGSSEL